MALVEAKEAARRAAFERRAQAHAQAQGAELAAALSEVLAPYSGVLSGYMAIRTEADPMPAMCDWARRGRVCVPVIEAKSQPLVFHEWKPGSEMVRGPFGASVPLEGAVLEPDVLIVPLVAFDRSGNRLGYGGGFYDRTLAMLRLRRPTLAIGLAYAGQEADELPLEPTDEPLDMIVTERAVLRFAAAANGA